MVAGNAKLTRNIVAMETMHKEEINHKLTNDDAIFKEKQQNGEMKHVPNGGLVTMEKHKNEIKDVVDEEAVIAETPQKEEIKAVNNSDVVNMATSDKEIKDVANGDVVTKETPQKDEIKDGTHNNVGTMETSENEIKDVANGGVVIAETAQKEDMKNITNGNIETQESSVKEEIKDVANNDVGGKETREEEIKDITNKDQSEKENEEAAQEGGHVKLKTLADLIHICRDKGYQIYDDKPNIPEAERKRQELIKEVENRNGKYLKHCADDPESIRKQRHRNKANGSLQSSAKSIYPKLGDWLDAQSRKTSAKSSMTGRTSRMSNMTSSTERPVGGIDADEWHQMRMRRKSRKRRELNGSLVDILKKRQEEVVETMSVKTLNTTENVERIETKQTERMAQENPEIKPTDNPPTRSNSPIKEPDTAQSPVRSKSPTNSEKVLEELQIKDGTSTLLLYKVKGKSKKSNVINDSSSEDLKTKSHVMTSDDETKEMSQENNNEEINIDEQNNSNVAELNKHNKEDTMSHSTNERSSNKTKHSSSAGKVKKEVRIRDGKSTLILYKVKDNAKSSSKKTEKNKGLTEKMPDAPKSKDQDISNANIIMNSDKNRESKSRWTSKGEKSIVNDAENSAVTPPKQVNNSDISLNKSQRRSHNKENSVGEYAESGESDDANSDDMHSEKLASTKTNRADGTLNSVDSDSKYVSNGNIKRKNGYQTSIADKKEHDTKNTEANIYKDKARQLVRGNQENKSNTKQIIENDSNSDSHGKDTTKERHNMVKDGDRDTARSGNNKEQTGVSSDKKMKSVRTMKTPKRSLGNGFLVSSDTEDDHADIHPLKVTKSNPKPTTENKNGDRKIENGRVQESKRSVLQDSKSGKSKPNESNTGKTSSVSEVSNTDTSGKNSSTSSKFSQLSPQARMILLLTKVKQSNQQYGDEHSKTINLLKETRLELRKDYKKFRNGLDIEDEVEKREEEIIEEKEEEVEEEEHVVEEPEVPIELEPKEETEEEEDSSDDDHEINVDINGDILRAIKENASSKIDTKWSADHPMFKKKKKKKKNKGVNREGEETKPGVKTKNTKKGTYYATNMPNENEYVKEAKRLYSRGSENRGDNKTTPRKKVINETHNPESVPNSKQTSVEDSKQNSRKSGTIPDDDKEGEDNTIDTSRSVQINRTARMEQKKGESFKNKPNTRNTEHAKGTINENEKETIKSSPRTKPGGRISLIPIKQKPKNDDVHDDDRLEIDRAFAKEYKMYLQNKSALPRTRNNVHANRNKDDSTRRNTNMKDLPNVDNDISQRENKNNMQANGDRWTDENENSENGLSEKYESVENKTDSHSEKSGEDGSMSGAVDIVKSRSKFYNEVKHGSGRRGPSRDNRVLKLFKEIQYIRKMAGPYSKRLPSNDDNYAISDPQTGFLLMDYGPPNGDLQPAARTSDQALNRFLHEKMEYEVCSKVRTVNMSVRKRERALVGLKQKLYLRT